MLFDPASESFLGDIEERLREEEARGISDRLAAVHQTKTMAVPGDAIITEANRFSKDGFEYGEIVEEIQRELAINMITPTGPVSRGVQWVGEKFNVDGKQYYKDTTGEDWVDETKLRRLVAEGRLRDRERKAIVRKQSSFTENLGTAWDELHRAIGYILPAVWDNSVGAAEEILEASGAGPRDLSDKKRQKAKDDIADRFEKSFGIAGVMGDEIIASAGAMITRPISYLREQPIDAASWIPLGIVKIPGAAAKASVAAKHARKLGLVKPMEQARVVKAVFADSYKNTKTGAVIRGGAAKTLDMLPVPDSVKRTFIDLYAGTHEKFKMIKKAFQRSRNADVALIEEVVLRPMQEILKKEKDPRVATQMYMALVGSLPTVEMRKAAVQIIRDVEYDMANHAYRGQSRAANFEAAMKGENDFIDMDYIKEEIIGNPDAVVEWNAKDVARPDDWNAIQALKAGKKRSPDNPNQVVIYFDQHKVRDLWEKNKKGKLGDRAPDTFENKFGRKGRKQPKRDWEDPVREPTSRLDELRKSLTGEGDYVDWDIVANWFDNANKRRPLRFNTTEKKDFKRESSWDSIFVTPNKNDKFLNIWIDPKRVREDWVKYSSVARDPLNKSTAKNIYQFIHKKAWAAFKKNSLKMSDDVVKEFKDIMVDAHASDYLPRLGGKRSLKINRPPREKPKAPADTLVDAPPISSSPARPLEVAASKSPSVSDGPPDFGPNPFDDLPPEVAGTEYGVKLDAPEPQPVKVQKNVRETTYDSKMNPGVAFTPRGKHLPEFKKFFKQEELPDLPPNLEGREYFWERVTDKSPETEMVLMERADKGRWMREGDILDPQDFLERKSRKIKRKGKKIGKKNLKEVMVHSNLPNMEKFKDAARTSLPPSPPGYEFKWMRFNPNLGENSPLVLVKEKMINVDGSKFKRAYGQLENAAIFNEVRNVKATNKAMKSRNSLLGNILKDMGKARVANALIAHNPLVGSSSFKYAEAAKQLDVPLNGDIWPTNETIAWATINGARKGNNAKRAAENVKDTVRSIKEVVEAGGTVIMDNPSRARTSYNKKGEGAVMDALNTPGLFQDWKGNLQKGYVNVDLETGKMIAYESKKEFNKFSPPVMSRTYTYYGAKPTQVAQRIMASEAKHAAAVAFGNKIRSTKVGASRPTVRETKLSPDTPSTFPMPVIRPKARKGEFDDDAMLEMYEKAMGEDVAIIDKIEAKIADKEVPHSQGLEDLQARHEEFMDNLYNNPAAKTEDLARQSSVIEAKHVELKEELTPLSLEDALAKVESVHGSAEWQKYSKWYRYLHRDRLNKELRDKYGVKDQKPTAGDTIVDEAPLGADVADAPIPSGKRPKYDNIYDLVADELYHGTTNKRARSFLKNVDVSGIINKSRGYRGKSAKASAKRYREDPNFGKSRGPSGEALARLNNLKGAVNAATPRYVTWNYDGVPMHTSEFLFDFDPKVWDASRITMKIADDAPEAIVKNAERLLEIKKSLFDFGIRQTKIRVNNLDNVANPQFLAEDFFKATVDSYFPLVKLVKDQKLHGVDEWFGAIKAEEKAQSAGMAGRISDKNRYKALQKEGLKEQEILDQLRKESDQAPLFEEGYAINERFMDALELSLPKLADTINRYEFYQRISRMSEIVSDVPKAGFEKISGPVVLKRGREFGGNIERYGALEGKYIEKNAKKVIEGAESHIIDVETGWTNFLRVHRRLLNVLKHNKLIANFSTQVHNILGIFQLMVGEGVSPTRYFSEMQGYRSGMKDKYYKALLESGYMPKAARGVGDVSDIVNSITKKRSIKQYMGLMFDDFQKAAVTDGKLVAGMSSLGRGAPELALQALEKVSYQGFGLGGRMAEFFTATDRLARYVFFKDRIKSIAKRNKISVEQALQNKTMIDKAAKHSSDVMLDYSDLPTFIAMLRTTGVAPFIAYPWRATEYYMKYPFKRPGTYKTTQAFREGVEAMDTPEERVRRRSAFPDDFIYPMGERARDQMSSVATALGGEPYKELNVSPRYWTPAPAGIHEAVGLSRNGWSGNELVGESDITALDERGPLSDLLGVSAPPAPLAAEPFLHLAKGDPKAAMMEVLPPYVSKISRDTLYGEEISKQHLISQALLGIRTLPQRQRKTALKLGHQKLKKLHGKPSMKKLSTGKRMQKEEEALRHSTRTTLF